MVVLIILFIILLVSFIFTLIKYIKLRKERKYTSRMYLLGGGVTFIFINLVNVLITLLINERITINTAISSLTSLGAYAIYILMPILIIEACILFISNIALIIKEGFRPRNMLGILFDIFVGLCAFLVLYFSNLSGSKNYVMIMSIIDNIIAYGTLYYILMFNSLVASSYMAVKHIPAFNQDYIIILGCRIRKNGSLSKLLQDRVDSAISFAKTQYKYSKKRVVFIPSGGKGSDEVISECLAMKNYLVSNGINEDVILLEDKSTNTIENINNSLKLIKNKDANIAIATTNYHLFRALSIGTKLSPNISGIAGKTKWYFYPNGFLREMVAVVNNDRLTHILIILGMILVYGLLTFVAYL